MRDYVFIIKENIDRTLAAGTEAYSIYRFGESFRSSAKEKEMTAPKKM